MDLMTWLPVAWFAVIGFGVLMYVVLDGFVLGIGILAPFAEDEEQLDLMMNTAAPIWDGNETWLVLGGAGLLAAFPKAYAVLLSALYLPVLLLVVALVFRGVAFEFRFKAHRSRRLWSVAFVRPLLLPMAVTGPCTSMMRWPSLLRCSAPGMPASGCSWLPTTCRPRCRRCSHR